MLEGARRTLSKPSVQKEPMSKDIIRTIIDKYGKDKKNLINSDLQPCASWGFMVS